MDMNDDDPAVVIARFMFLVSAGLGVGALFAPATSLEWWQCGLAGVGAVFLQRLGRM